MKTVQEVLNGKYELNAGLFLQDANELIADQPSWGEGDSCVDFDFTTHPYYLTTDDGQTPVGYNLDEDINELCKAEEDEA